MKAHLSLSFKRTMLSAFLAALALVMAACASKASRTVVVEDRPIGRAPAGSTASRVPTPDVGSATSSGVGASTDAASNAGKPGYYTVKPGDTLVRIGLDHGQNWRDIARWNQIDKPNLIEVGQVLRVRPEASPARPVAKAGERSERVERADRPPVAGAAATGSVAGPSGGVGGVGGVGSSGNSSTAGAPSVSAPPRAGGAVASATGAEASRESAAEASSGDVNWAWPAAGAVVQGFDEQRNKGLDIGGKAGDPVLAAADGRVVYAGSALRGYGNLVILKHNGTFLSAYAHNQTLLVKEDQAVKRGQKIAEMGSSDAERVQLHFEIRRDGKPVDPARYLPAR